MTVTRLHLAGYGRSQLKYTFWVLSKGNFYPLLNAVKEYIWAGNVVSGY